MAARVVLTYRDYEALPNDGKRYEIHDGELSVTAAPSFDHQLVLARLFRVLDRHVESRHLGVVLFSPLDVILADTTILQPDLVFLSNEHLAGTSRRGVEGPPMLVIEAISPSTATNDRGIKRQLYARYAVPYYWIVDVEGRVVEAFVLRSGDYVEVARVSGPAPVDLPPFPGLGLIPDSLWPPELLSES